MKEYKIYALHIEGKLMTKEVWKLYDKSKSYAAVKPKRIYHNLGTAKAVISYFPKELRHMITIVEYLPGSVVHRGS